jgi:hypothetical protein
MSRSGFQIDQQSYKLSDILAGRTWPYFFTLALASLGFSEHSVDGKLIA